MGEKIIGTYIMGNMIIKGEMINGDQITRNGKNEKIVASDKNVSTDEVEYIELDSRAEYVEQGGNIYKLVDENEDNTKCRYKKLQGKKLRKYLNKKKKVENDRFNNGFNSDFFTSEKQKPAPKEPNYDQEPTLKELPTWESIKNNYPEGSITEEDYVGKRIDRDGSYYKLAQPEVKTQSGYVYIPYTE